MFFYLIVILFIVWLIVKDISYLLILELNPSFMSFFISFNELLYLFFIFRRCYTRVE